MFQGVPLCRKVGSDIAASIKDFDNLPWNILMLMGGGLALGYTIQASSLLDVVSTWLAQLVSGLSVWVVLLVRANGTLVA